MIKVLEYTLPVLPIDKVRYLMGVGKPENIIEKIAQGKLQKFFKDNTLLSQPFVKDSSQTVEKYLGSYSADLTVNKFI